MTALQVQSAYDSLSRHLKDTSNVSVTLFSEWCDWINKEVYRMMCATDPERYIAEATYTVTSTTSTQALPAAFRSMDTYGTGLFWQNADGTATDRQLPRTNYGSSATGYYLNAGNIVFTPPSDDNVYTFTMRFIPNISTISAFSAYFTSDTTATGREIIPAEYLSNLIHLLTLKYSIWDEDPSMESMASQRYMNALDEFVRNIRRESNNTFMPDTSSDFSNIYTLY